MNEDCRLWVGGLPSDISETELLDEFAKFGSVGSVAIRSTPYDTFAFVQMGTRQTAEAAITAMNQSPMWGSQRLNVKIAHDNPKRQRGSRATWIPSRPTPRLLTPPRNDDVEKRYCIVRGRSRSRPLPAKGTQSNLSESASTLRSLTDGPPSSPPMNHKVSVRLKGRAEADPLNLWSDDLFHPSSLGHAKSLEFTPTEAPPDRYRKRKTFQDDWLIATLPSRYRQLQEFCEWRDQTLPPTLLALEDDPRMEDGSRSGYINRERQLALPAPPIPGFADRSPSRSPSPVDLVGRAPAECRAQHLALLVENIPPDMSWPELKSLGQMYGVVAYARTFRDRARSIDVGVLEFSHRRDVEAAVSALDNRMMEGGVKRLRVRRGVPSELLRPVGQRR